MEITVEIVDAAAKAMWETSGTRTHDNWELEHPYIREEWWDAAREALEAVAPLIAAQALRDAANAPTCDNVPAGASCLACDTRMFLREAADRIEAGQ